MALLPEIIASTYVAFNQTLLILGIVGSITSSLFLIIIIYKEMSVKKVMAKAVTIDPIWNENALKVFARATFYKVQHAWSTGDTNELISCTTSKMLESLKRKISNRPAGLKQITIGSIDIHETNIICSKDNLTDDDDKYIVIMKGVLTTYNKYQAESSIANEFIEMYHFDRNKTRWLLEKITGNPKLIDLLTIRSSIEI